MTREDSTSRFLKGVPQPAVRALEAAGYSHWEQLTGKSKSELSKLHGVGQKALRIINQALIDGGKKPLQP
jgi:hypothetical protein